MEHSRVRRTWILLGAAFLALGVIASRPAKAPVVGSEELRDAVAAPVSPALLGGARVIQPNAGYFASPAGRRAEAERALLSSRAAKVSKATRARAAKLRRQAERERALAVSAQ